MKIQSVNDVGNVDAIYIDMDGVLVDLIDGIAKLFSTSENVLSIRNWKTRGDYCVAKNLLGIDAEKMWETIDECGREFWENLSFTRELISIVFKSIALVQRRHKERPVSDLPLFVVSSPHDPNPEIYAGKVAWINKHLKTFANRFILTTDKSTLARPGVLLIDDNDREVERFVAAGGDAYLVPRIWNSAHDLPFLF